MNFKRFHESKNLLSEKYENRSINGSGAFTIDNTYDLWLGEVVAGQTYAISNMNYVYGFFTAKPLPNTGATYDGSRGYEISGTAVVTVPSGCTWIAVRVLHNADNAMCNAGSTALPYEPYSSEVWHDTPHYIHNTSTDIITTPADIYANDTTATVGLKGQTVQSSIPSPTSPVMPQGTGERTGNVLDYTTVENTSTATATQISGGISVSGRYYVQFKTVKFTVGSSYTMSWTAKTVSGTVTTMWRFRYSDNTYSSMPSSGGSLVAEKEVAALLLYVNTSSTASGVAELTNIMLNTGSTALPYEPYGYEIPISSANTTTPVYLGEVQTTRQVKKYEFTGNEGWAKGNYAPSGGYQFFTRKPSDIANNPDWLMTHFKKGSGLNGSAFASYLSLYPEASILPENATANDFKEWLAAQYAAGTPVTVWYVLATEETGIVNEPLMKIGDYADEVSGITIPTVAGANTLSVDTTLQPSEVSVNYKGWHPVQSVHEAENGQWD